MKVALITDLHFGARNDNNKFLDYYELFYSNTFFPRLKKDGIDTVLILGDTFDSRRIVNFNTLDRTKKMFFDVLRDMNIQVHMLAGNHDCHFKATNEVNSPELLLPEYQNVNVISSPKTITIDDIPICMIPWICDDNKVQSFKEMKNTNSDICMGHFEIAGFAMYRGMEAHEGLPQEIFKKFDKVFSGHYHHRSSSGNIYYLGNPYELTWQDYNDPRGFHIFDLKTRDLEFIENPYKMFVRIEYDDKDTEPVNLSKIEVKDRFVKLIVVNKTDLYKYDQFVSTIQSKAPYDLKIIEDMSEFQEGEIEETINLEDTVSLLTNYIDSIETDADKEALKKYMKALYTEALNVEDV